MWYRFTFFPVDLYNNMFFSTKYVVQKTHWFSYTHHQFCRITTIDFHHTQSISFLICWFITIWFTFVIYGYGWHDLFLVITNFIWVTSRVCAEASHLHISLVKLLANLDLSNLECFRNRWYFKNEAKQSWRTKDRGGRGSAASDPLQTVANSSGCYPLNPA